MAEAQENAIKQAKIKRRNCKGALTRQGKVVCHKLSANRPAGAVVELASLMKTFGSGSYHETAKFSKSTPTIYPV